MAWLIGVLLDLLHNLPIGTNALALSLATYFLIKFSTKISLMDFWKKVLVNFGLIAWCQLLPWFSWAYLDGYFGSFLIFLGQVIMTTLVWLIITLFLNYQQQIHLESSY